MIRIKFDDSWYKMSNSETYEVVFESGIELDFNKKGEITEIETEDEAEILASVLPGEIHSNIARDYPNAELVAWEKDKNGHKVELRDGTELKIDPNGKIKKRK